MQPDQAGRAQDHLVSRLYRRTYLFSSALGGSCLLAGFQLWQFPYPRTALMYGGVGFLMLALITWFWRALFDCAIGFARRLDAKPARYALAVFSYALALVMLFFQLSFVLFSGVYIAHVSACVMESNVLCTKNFEQLSERDRAKIASLRKTKNAWNAVSYFLYTAAGIPERSRRYQ
jgi:hypothetical protein